MGNIKKVVGPQMIPMASFERRQSPRKDSVPLKTVSEIQSPRMYKGKARNGIVVPRKSNA